MKKLLIIPLTTAFVNFSFAQTMNKMGIEKTVMVGGAAMYPSKNIVENTVNSKDHTTLVAAIKAGPSRNFTKRRYFHSICTNK